MFLSLSLFFSMLLPCSFVRLKELFQVKNGSVGLNGDDKEDGLNVVNKKNKKIKK